jgi:glycine betaine/proline transport system substrate-binding protein
VSTEFEAEQPEVAAFLTKMSFGVAEMSAILAWQDENGASAEETAVNFLQNNKETWSSWLSDDARAKLANIL